ncbi:MAG: hypothetical protein HY434_01745 [Candidatus Liptonbacteria bacterium]|nr:hypothetical protein [Candidatus Liptonbacteria bacterium]
MDTIVIGLDVFRLIVIAGIVGWVLAIVLWVFVNDFSKKIEQLRQFIADFVDYGRVDEVLARRARILARNCAQVVEFQMAKAKGEVDAESIEAAFAKAMQGVRSYKPEFFHPLDGLKVAGFKARGNSHKVYLASVAEDLEAIDAARLRIGQKLDALASAKASKS